MMATYLYAAVAAQNNFDRYRVQQGQAKRLRNKVHHSHIIEQLVNLVESLCSVHFTLPIHCGSSHDPEIVASGK